MKKLDFKIGYRCNNMCRFCAQGDKRDRLSELGGDEVMSLLKGYSSEYREIVFTGGEPTLGADIVKWVAAARGFGFSAIQIQSNGRAFSSMRFCREMAEAGATQFALALHGHNEACHDYLTRAPGSFLQTTRGILNLLRLGLDVVVNVVVTRSNFRNLPQVATLLTGLGIRNFQFAFVHPVGAARTGFRAVVPRKTLAAPYMKEGLNIGRLRGAVAYTEGVPYCFMRGFEDCVVEIKIPDAKIHERTKIIENFTEVRINEAKSRGPQCPECAFYCVCEGPWAEYPANYGWDEFVPRSDEADRVIVSRIKKHNGVA